MSDIAALGFEIDSTQARNAAKDLDRLTAAADKTERSAKKLSTASRDLLRDESGRFMSAAQAADKYASEIDQLRMKYNPLYAASKQFEAQQGELQRALALGAISVAQYDVALAGLQSGMVRSGGAVDQFGKNMQVSTHHATNLSYQLNDIGMMMASGQSPFMLMLQQGPQVSQIFNAMTNEGKKIGPTLASAFTSILNPTTLLTMGVIAGGAALVQWGMSAMGASEDARTLDDAMSELDAASSGLKSTQDILKMSVDELKAKYGEFAFLVKEVAAGLAQNQIATMNNLLTEQVIAGAEAFDQFTAKMDAATASAQYLAAEEAALQGVMLDGAVVLSGAAAQTEQSIRNMMETLGVTRQVAIGLADDFARVRNASSMEDRVAAFIAIDRALNAAGVSATKLPPEINKAMEEAKTLSIKLAEGKTQAQALADAAPGPGWMSSAIGETNMLIGRLVDAKAAADLVRNFSAAAGANGGVGELPIAKPLEGGTATIDLWRSFPSSGSKGGGGGGATNEMADRYKALEKGFASEMMLKMQQYALDQETLKWALDTKKITLEQYKDEEEQMRILAFGSQMEQGAIKYQLEQDALQAALDQKLISQEMYNQQVAALRQQEMDTTLGHYDSLFSNMATIAKAGGDKATGAVKAFSIAQGLINSYLAFTQVLADPSLVGRPFMRIALAGSTLAAGLAQVSAMGGGSGGGGSARATTSATSATRAEPDRVTRVELQGEDWLVSLAESMMTQIYDASKNGRVIVARA